MSIQVQVAELQQEASAAQGDDNAMITAYRRLKGPRRGHGQLSRGTERHPRSVHRCVAVRLSFYAAHQHHSPAGPRDPMCEMEVQTVKHQRSARVGSEESRDP